MISPITPSSEESGSLQDPILCQLFLPFHNKKYEVLRNMYEYLHANYICNKTWMNSLYILSNKNVNKGENVWMMIPS